MKKKIALSDMSRPVKKPLIHLEGQDLMPLPPPLDGPQDHDGLAPLSSQIVESCECFLDDTCVVNFPQPKTREEENELVGRFLSGLEKLFKREDNWTFLQPLVLTMEHCTKCQTCSDACHI